MNYFTDLAALLDIERQADREAYLRLTREASPAARRAAGVTWYPIAIRGTEPSRGDYITIEVERTTHQDDFHQLRFGASAMLFSNHHPQEHRIAGTITWQGGNRLKLLLRTEELPDWADDGKLGIDLLFDEASYQEMERALKMAAVLAEDKREGRLVRILTGAEQPTFDQPVPTADFPTLNASQQAAAARIISIDSLAIVHGPPGTGKTTTLVQAVRALVQRGEQVLVTAPSNTAVDLLSEKLAAEGINVLRVGNPARVSEQLTALTLDSRMAAHPAMKEMKKLKKQAAEFKNMAHKYKRNFGKAEREQRKALFDEAHRIMKEVGNTEQYVTNDLVSKAQVIAATLVGAAHYTVRHLKYKTIVIDEAGQALEPACWIPILKGEKVILAGDHFQLPPTVKSTDAARKGLSTTLLEKCAVLHPAAVTMLEEQYRMHQLIMGYSAQVFYRDALKAHASAAGRLLFAEDVPLAFIDTAGCGFEEAAEGTSATNPEEGAFLLKYLSRLAAQLAAAGYTADNFPTTGIISPYKGQIEILKEGLAHSTELQPYMGRITVNTIDSFQGQERDMICISMTRSNTEGIIGFLSDVRRMNVAMTRARKKLIVIGDSATLSSDGFYRDFIDYAQQHDAYQSAWEFMD